MVWSDQSHGENTLEERGRDSRGTSHKYFRTSTTTLFFFLDTIVLATYQVVFAGFVSNQFLSDFKNKHTAAKVL